MFTFNVNLLQLPSFQLLPSRLVGNSRQLDAPETCPTRAHLRCAIRTCLLFIIRCWEYMLYFFLALDLELNLSLSLPGPLQLRALRVKSWGRHSS